MKKERAEILTNQLIKTYKEEGASYKVINEGVFTIEAFWGDIVNLVEHRGFNLESVMKFLQSDEKLIKTIKEVMVTHAEKYIYESLLEWEPKEKEEGDLVKPQYYG